VVENTEVRTRLLAERKGRQDLAAVGCGWNHGTQHSAEEMPRKKFLPA
jgi:hypothetical protein